MKESIIAKVQGFCHAFGCTIQDVIDTLVEFTQPEPKPDSESKVKKAIKEDKE